MRILRDGAKIDGHSFAMYKGQRLSSSIDCSVIENTANFSLSLTWMHNSNKVQTVSSGQLPDIYQVNENKMQRLYINKTADSDDEVYACHVSVGNATVLSQSFTLKIIHS